jgi:hypothetical protein
MHVYQGIGAWGDLIAVAVFGLLAFTLYRFASAKQQDIEQLKKDKNND